MTDRTNIEWADYTFNPWIGCTKVSDACDNCYAETQNNHRKWNRDGWGAKAPRKRTSQANWKNPLKWNRLAEREGKRFRVFCASLADVFDNHGSITSGWHGDLWALIEQTPNLDWLLLTKRPQNINKMLPETYGLTPWHYGWENVWLGTTVENQTEAERRIPHLLRVNAKVHFLSCEPLLSPIHLDSIAGTSSDEYGSYDVWWDAFSGTASDEGGEELPMGDWIDPGIDWVIAGGESGPNARPTHPDWIRDLRDQCKASETPFFFKQWGEWLPWEIGPAPDLEAQDGRWMDANQLPDIEVDPRWKQDWINEEFEGHCLFEKVGKKRAGRLLDGVLHNEVPTTL